MGRRWTDGNLFTRLDETEGVESKLPVHATVGTVGVWHTDVVGAGADQESFTPSGV